MERRPNYSAKELIEYAGITTAAYREWTAKDVFEADVLETLGTGHHRRFAFWNIAEARIARELRTLGISVPAVRSLLQQSRTIEKITNPAIQEQLEFWQDFRDPKKRPDGAVVFLAITTVPTHATAWPLAVEGLWWSLLLIGIDEDDIPLSRLTWPATTLINMRSILEELEAATNDYWRPEPDWEVDARLREASGLPPVEYTGRWWEKGLPSSVEKHFQKEDPGFAGDDDDTV